MREPFREPQDEPAVAARSRAAPVAAADDDDDGFKKVRSYRRSDGRRVTVYEKPIREEQRPRLPFPFLFLNNN